MASANFTRVTSFILRGIIDNPKLQVIIFMLFFFIYLCTLIGNLGMIALIKVNPQLHTSMYFFLSNLSLLDVIYSTVIAPKALVISLGENKNISFTGCMVQFFFLSLCANTELCLLAAMAYDHFIAICNSLLYHLIMSKKVCIQLIVISYICAFVNAITHTSSLFSLSFCHSNVLDHFFCDIPPLQKISCSDIRLDELVHFIFAALATLTTIMIILISYLYIIFAILRIKSAEGKCKAFNTCASHLTAVAILYGTLFFMYLRPSSSDLADQDKVVSVFYTMVIPMLNPLIYSLRNKEVKNALWRTISQKVILQCM